MEPVNKYVIYQNRVLLTGGSRYEIQTFYKGIRIQWSLLSMINYIYQITKYPAIHSMLLLDSDNWRDVEDQG